MSNDIKLLLARRLEESGEKARLMEHLRSRLIESGWRDELKLQAKEHVRKEGVENITVDDLVAKLTPVGRASVPDAVKRELLGKIKEFLAQQNNI